MVFRRGCCDQALVNASGLTIDRLSWLDLELQQARKHEFNVRKPETLRWLAIILNGLETNEKFQLTSDFALAHQQEFKCFRSKKKNGTEERNYRMQSTMGSY